MICHGIEEQRRHHTTGKFQALLLRITASEISGINTEVAGRSRR